MRTYLIDEDRNEITVDLIKTVIHSRSLVEFEFATVENDKSMNSKVIMIRRLAGSLFSSSDGIRWEKIAKQMLPKKVVNVDRVFDIYRGFKPSGLGGASEGTLLTKMPGKVVEISVSEGDRVSKGQKLLVLEAMKMENEIKSGIDGIVKNICVEEGDTLQAGIVMIEVEGE